MFQPAQDEKGYQCCPNLDLEGVLAGTKEGTDMKVLLNLPEELLNIPPCSVNVRYGSKAEVKEISQENDLLTGLLIYGYHSSEVIAAAGNPDHLVIGYEMVDAVGYRSVLDNLIEGIAAHPGNEVHLPARKVIIEAVRVVTSIEDHYGALPDLEEVTDDQIVRPSFGDVHEVRHHIRSIEKYVHLGGTFACAVNGPFISAVTEGYHC